MQEFKVSGLIYPVDTTMKGLGQIVCLIGKNGSGKSRLLQHAHAQAPGAKALVLPGADKRPDDPSNWGPVNFQNLDNSLKSFGQFEKAARSSWRAYLQMLVNNNHDAQHPVTKAATPIDAQKAAERFEAAKSLIHDVADLSFGEHFPPGSLRPAPTLNGRPITPVLMSDGQLELLAYSVRLLEQSSQISGAHLFLDEPETHLHPEAVSILLERLLKAIGTGQIWVATHSLAIVSAIASSNVWLLSKGVVLPPSIERVSEAVSELLGGTERVARFRMCLDEAAAWAAARFAEQCLIPPENVVAKPGDPQGQIVSGAISSSEAAKPTIILDFGAGTGRLAVALSEREDLRGRIRYYAFEPDRKKHESIRRSLAELQRGDPAATTDSSLFASMNELRLSHPPLRPDWVVLCNVLHEIPPTEWTAIFRSIFESLSETGHLLILEDSEIPVGELPNKFGFLLFGESEFCKLFDIPTAALESKKHPDLRYSERLTSVSIPRERLQTIHIQAALEALRLRAEMGIKELRSRASDDEKLGASDGRKFGRLAESCINAKFAGDELPRDS